jgi:Mn-dependent DtxR family transcriptional regulator
MAKRRGRPRPQETIQRDDRLVRVLEEAPDSMTKYELAEALEVSPSVVYLALRRLKADGRVRHVSLGKRHSWKPA